jgi:hypothetical protein
LANLSGRFSNFSPIALACGAAKSVHVTVVDATERNELGHYGVDGNRETAPREPDSVA